MLGMEDIVLSPREKEVYDLLGQDKTTKEIAELLCISEITVRNHISNGAKKLGVKGRLQAICKLVRLGKLQIKKKKDSYESLVLWNGCS
ncbi:helix-turn-helix transcriptional regulator [Neobacillus cucumis]|nr:helix-turn-helix transcriptional regulator [Neobacillus cucumis]